MTSQPRLLVIKGEAGGSVRRLCDSLSKVAELVLVNICSPTPHMEATHREASAALADRGELIPLDSYESCDRIVEAVSGKPIDGILTLSEHCLILAAEVAAELGLRHISPKVARRVRDKYAQRGALRDAGIPCPAFARIASPDDFEAAAATVKMPAVLKPESGAGGHDTFRVDSRDELRQLYETARRGEIGLDAEHEPTFILEEMLIGETWHEREGWGDYASVESFHFDGETLPICITDRTPLAPPFRETGVFLPSSLPPGRAEALRACARDAAAALGIDNGITHTEIKFTAEGPRIIEVNARLGGHMGYVFEYASGRDIVAEAGLLALGQRPDTAYRFARHAGWILLTPPQSEKPMRAIGLDRIASVPNVMSAVISDAKTFDWRLGEVGDPALITVVADSAEELLQTRQRILETVEFR